MKATTDAKHEAWSVEDEAKLELYCTALEPQKSQGFNGALYEEADGTQEGYRAAEEDQSLSYSGLLYEKDDGDDKTRQGGNCR